jgi:hypothetical protein
MSTRTVGLLAGMALGFAGYFGDFGAFLLVAGLGALGLIVGSFLQGDLVVGDFVRRREGVGRRESSRASRRSQSDFGPTRGRVS